MCVSACECVCVDDMFNCELTSTNSFQLRLFVLWCEFQQHRKTHTVTLTPCTHRRRRLQVLEIQYMYVCMHCVPTQQFVRTLDTNDVVKENSMERICIQATRMRRFARCQQTELCSLIELFKAHTHTRTCG